MLQSALCFALCLFLTLEGHSSKKTVVVEKRKSDPLVEAVEKSLGICLGITGHMTNFRRKFRAEDAHRRLEGSDEPVVDGVGKKMNTCWKVFDAVNSGRKKYCNGGNQDHGDRQGEVVTVNVGGTLFTTNLTTLKSDARKRFERMCRGGMNRRSSADGTYFIDRSPRTFGYIMDYLRTGDMFVSNNAEVRLQLLDDAEYFELPRKVTDYLRWKPINGIDLRLSEVCHLNEQLKLVKEKMGEVLYEAAQDGDSSSRFHSLCDKQGSNVVIIMTNTGNVFGGYSSVSWQSRIGHSGSSKAFLFRLRPSFKRYDIKSTSYSIYHQPDLGPVFGANDICIVNEALKSRKSCVYNNHYHGKGFDINNGVQNFKVQDYAVVQTIPL